MAGQTQTTNVSRGRERPDADEERFEGATPRDAWQAFEAGVSAQGSDVHAASDAVGDGTVTP